MGGLDTVSISALVQILTSLGPYGLLIVLWWLDMKNMRQLIEQHRSEVSAILKQSDDGLNDVREMYKNNVLLVEKIESLAASLKDIVIMNTESQTRLAEEIRQNQFCPNMRVERRTEIHGRKGD